MILTRTVLIATGARYRKLAVPRLEHFEGTSVYYARREGFAATFAVAQSRVRPLMSITEACWMTLPLMQS